MTSGKDPYPEIHKGFSNGEDSMEKKIKKDTKSKSRFKSLMKRPDFPLFLLGGFVMVLLFFILVRLPVDSIGSEKSPVVENVKLGELKKSLKDIRDEIIEIRYAVSSGGGTKEADLVAALNRFEQRFDKRLSRIEESLKIREKSVVKKESPQPKKAEKKLSKTKNLSKNTKPPVKKPKFTHTKNRGKKVYYYVKRGDTLYGISRKFSIPITKIKSLNRMKNNSIHPGEKILIKNQ